MFVISYITSVVVSGSQIKGVLPHVKPRALFENHTGKTWHQLLLADPRCALSNFFHFLSGL